MCKVYLGLGSNQGDRLSYIQQATQAIEQEIGTVEKSSSYYETEPWGFVAENKFINQVVKIDTGLSVTCVLKHILLIEKQMGRNRVLSEQKYSSREIDIDILFYDNQRVSLPDLEVPHPHIPRRGFVLEPMNEIAPDFVHPVYQTSIKSLLSNCDDNMQVRRLSVKDVFEKPFTSEINPDFKH
jgi:2-amino-4-hydroxy-6-hydroxymethyldihydropteridine diphosphokinase